MSALTQKFQEMKLKIFGRMLTRDELAERQLRIFQLEANDALAPELRRLYDKYHPKGQAAITAASAAPK